MKKTVALNSAVPVVRSGKLPAPRKPVKWRDFNRFVADVDTLHEYFRELNSLRFNPNSDGFDRTSGDVEDDADFCRALVEKCKAGFEKFDRADNYDDDGTLSETHVAKRLGMMIGAFPNVNPGTPQDYARMLVEHVAAFEGLTDVALESACREIVETKKFAPAISEAMEAITDHVLKWKERRREVSHVENVRRLTIETLQACEKEKKKQEHEDEVRRATYTAKQAMDMTQRLAKEIETAKAALAALVQRHADSEKRETELMRKLRELTPEREANGG
jgi:hypothetical protein